MNAAEIIRQLEKTSSVNEKTQILNANASDATLQLLFKTAYDSQINYYIRDLPVPDEDEKRYPRLGIMQAILHVINDRIPTRKFTGNAARDILSKTLLQLEYEDAVMVHRAVVLRDMRCGVNKDLIKRVWPKLVPEHPVMLCQPDTEKNRKKITFPAYAQLKSDGLRINIMVQFDSLDQMGIQFLSRQGKKVACANDTLVSEIVEYVNLLPTAFARSGVMLDGELIYTNPDGTDTPREIGNGKANKATKGDLPADERLRFRVDVWDVVPLDVVYGKDISPPYSERFQHLQALKGTSKLRVIPSHLVVNWEEAEAIYDKYIAEGREGMIVKSLDSIWENRRSVNQVKMKSEFEAEFQITNWTEGNGKYQGMIGSLVMESSDKKIRFNCSGMDDGMRAANPAKLLKQIATVRFNGVMKESGGTHSIYLPRIVVIRGDKDQADSFETVMEISGGIR